MEHHAQQTIGDLSFAFCLETVEAASLQMHTTVEPVVSLPDTYLVRCTARGDGTRFTVAHASVRWEVPAADMHGFYAAPPSLPELSTLPFYFGQHTRPVGANRGVPYIGLQHRSGENRAAFGLLDQLSETDLDTNLSEITRLYHFHWRKPISGAKLVMTTWQETLFVSLARVRWMRVLRAYVDTVDSEWPQPKLAVPDAAYDPVFCTWTAIHHDVSQEWILRNAEIASELGFGTWLTDDGWFTDKASFADYRYAGDWEPCLRKFPDFTGHVRAVQDMGMRYLLWTAPFMVGYESHAFQTYRHLIDQRVDRLNMGLLSPWRRETGEIVRALLERLVCDYSLDGLKLDFVDAVSLEQPCPDDADFATVGEGLYTILCQAVEPVAASKPGLLIELRNCYTNLAARRYGNLYRASDVPINFAWNRWQVSTTRLLAPDRAAHFDPALWHPDDSDENVAVHLINAIASVPMVSVELDSYPQRHLDLIRHWIGFYRKHQDTIIHGEFAPEFHLGWIPLTRFDAVHERIIGLYADVAFALGDGPTPLTILNASTRPFVQLLPDGFAGAHHVIQRDKFGRVVGESEVRFPVARLPVEVGGSVEIRVP